MCKTFVENFRVELSRYSHTEHLELLLRTFVWNFHSTFTRNLCVELLLGTFMWNFRVTFSHGPFCWELISCGIFLVFSHGTFWELWIGTFDDIFGGTFVENFWVPRSCCFCCFVCNSANLGRRPTLRVCANLSAELVDLIVTLVICEWITWRPSVDI